MNSYVTACHFHGRLNQAKVNAWLIGFVEGILVDKEVTSEELIALSQEIRACAERWDVPYDMLDVADDIEANCYSCAEDSREALIFAIEQTLKLRNDSARFDEVRDLGRLAGVAADNTLTEGELSLAQAICDTLDKGASGTIESRIARWVGDGYCQNGTATLETPAGFDDISHELINLRDQQIVVTGVSSTSPRSAIIEHIETAGGRVKTAVSKRTDVLVVLGSSPNWVAPTYGTKLKKALQLKLQGAKIAIISEFALQNAIEEMHALK